MLNRLESGFDWARVQQDLMVSGILLEKQDIILRELVRFFAIKAMLRDIDGTILVAPPLLDDLWSYLLQFPKDYLEMCRVALGGGGTYPSLTMYHLSLTMCLAVIHYVLTCHSLLSQEEDRNLVRSLRSLIDAISTPTHGH